MPHINLLPWREELRQQQRQEFLVMLGVAAAVGVLVGVLVLFGFIQIINQQKARNQYLTAEIAKLDKKLEEIRTLRKKKEDFLARIRAIEGLQTQRPLNVRIFDEVVGAVPDGLSITEMSLSGERLSLGGVAQSNARVSSLMRNLEASAWMQKPNLEVIQARAGRQLEGQARLLDFKVGAMQVVPKAPDSEL